METRSRPGQRARANHRRLLVLVGLAVLLAGSLATTSRQAQASSPLPAAPPPVAPYQPGDKVWVGEAPPVVLSPLGTGCQRIPSTGYVATGATARTTGEYSNYWNWTAASAGQAFDWWIYSTGGTLYASGHSTGGGGAATVPANINYWKVKNLGASPQAWNACWSG